MDVKGKRTNKGDRRSKYEMNTLCAYGNVLMKTFTL
jgi:hypothetical protein